MKWTLWCTFMWQNNQRICLQHDTVFVHAWAWVSLMASQRRLRIMWVLAHTPRLAHRYECAFKFAFTFKSLLQQPPLQVCAWDFTCGGVCVRCNHTWTNGITIVFRCNVTPKGVPRPAMCKARATRAGFWASSRKHSPVQKLEWQASLQLETYQLSHW